LDVEDQDDEYDMDARNGDQQSDDEYGQEQNPDGQPDDQGYININDIPVNDDEQ